jgi:hypothetical protein
MKLWIVETYAGTSNVVYAVDAAAAAAGVRDWDRTLVCGVREWPAENTFSVAFVPTTVPSADAAIQMHFWDGVADAGTFTGLGHVREAVAVREDFTQHLEDEHQLGHHHHNSQLGGYCQACQRTLLNGAIVSVYNKDSEEPPGAHAAPVESPRSRGVPPPGRGGTL